MSGKTQNIYVCANCDAQFSKWSGRCLECGAWGTLKMETRKQEEIDSRLGGKAREKEVSQAEIINLEKIAENGLSRIKTNISELDRVLGGGIVPGSLVLLAGEPGIGKSTIVAQLADAIGKSHGDVIYLSGEESASQIKARLVRLNCNLEKIKFISETNVEKAIAAISSLAPALVVVDSIQAVYSTEVLAEAGGLNQIRASAVKFLELAKENNIAVILVGHITKDGQIAGPKSLEHIVDTVIYLETETANNYRVLRATKNRFGSVNELGIFEMTGSGFKEVINPGAVFIETSGEKITGSVISCILEGTRPFLVEIQALVTKTVFGYPQRKSSGFDLNRLQVLASVLTKRAKVNLVNQDIILNVVGGFRVNDPGLDLAVCLAITSSLLNQVIDRKTLVLGEVGLGGEVRNVSKLEQRLAEAEKLGFNRALAPDSEIKVKKLELVKIKNLEDMVGQIAQIA
ncbi:MAG: DNA repair protein RadA [Patescibacteria group bacterium]|nr:DNA repair protein RadA [Patescibacteria group bacterium]